MKKLFALLLFLILPFAPVGAQGLHGKILIVRDSIWQAEDRVEALLPSIYSGTVDSMSSFPPDISQYDAILFFPDSRNGYPSDTISIEDEFRLIDYLKNGGRLYAEGGFFLSGFQYPDTLLYDTLWQFLGLQFESVDDIEVSYDAVHGVDSEFTHGIDTTWPQDPFGMDGDYFPKGNITPVLFATADEDYIFGWIPTDLSIRAVVHHSDGQILDRYYNIFFTRVLCDYFGLCVDAVKEAPPAVPVATLRVVNDGVSTSIVVSSEESGTLDVANALGVTVYHLSVNSGTSQIELPETLQNGVYFARLQTEHGGQVQPFAIVAR
jgi:hypothetical protein